MTAIGRVVVFIGLVTLLHAAYSAIQHRTYLKLTGEQFDSLPTDIIWQTLIGFLITILGVVSVAGKFSLINSTTDPRNSTWDSFGNRASFYSFNHRPSLIAELNSGKN